MLSVKIIIIIKIYTFNSIGPCITHISYAHSIISYQSKIVSDIVDLPGSVIIATHINYTIYM